MIEYYMKTRREIVFKTGVKSPKCLTIRTIFRKKDLENMKEGDLYFKKVRTKETIQSILPHHRIPAKTVAQYGYIKCRLSSHKETARFLNIEPAKYVLTNKDGSQVFLSSNISEIVYDEATDSTHILWNLNIDEGIMEKERSRILIPNARTGYYQIFWDGKPPFEVVKL